MAKLEKRLTPRRRKHELLFADGAWPERNGRPIDPPSLERERGFERRADVAGVELAASWRRCRLPTRSRDRCARRSEIP
jgi:hypothetical protein